ncbi:MAG: hypothetical protein L6R42_006810 [Xanthoria sp. 1 TBL-2021]|nr:MAG: hypothetical protein L6R42_006810 [Xanthoria sp. 1 TBL-2021]
MAEIVSAIPTSGGPYFWAYMLAPPHHAPFFAWITGWSDTQYLQSYRIRANLSFRFNLIGQIAITTGIAFGLANLISTTASISNGYEGTAGKTLGILAVILLSQVAVNLVSVHKLRYMIYTSIALNSPSNRWLRVFGKFFDGTAADDNAEGWSIRASPAYVAATGVLVSQYTFTGYDASAHLCEETRRAVRDAPLGLLSASAASACLGFFVIVAMLFSIQDFDTVRESPLPIFQILTDACGRGGGLVLMAIPHRLHIIDARFKAPIRTVIFGATCSFLLALPALGSQVAFNGTTSIATISLYVSYGIPIAMTLAYPQKTSNAALSNSAIQTLNYTPVALGIVGFFASGTWFLWARKWFTGRCRDHCRICIRQLDFMGEEMVTRRSNAGGWKWDSNILQQDRHAERFENSDRGSDQKSQVTVSRDFEIRQDQGL